MDKKYLDLFLLISQSVANLAEQVMTMHEKQNEQKEKETAEIMRNDFLDLHDKIKNQEQLKKADFARLLVGTIIITNQLENRIKNEEKALQGYKIDIIPKLDQINNSDLDDISDLVNDLFSIKEEKDDEKK